MNYIYLCGRLTAEPEIKEAGENKYLRFCLAVDRMTKEKKTDFIDCIAWNRQADVIASYVKKGNELSIMGSLETSSYEKDGKKIKGYCVRVNAIKLHSSSHEASEPAETPAPAPEPQPEPQTQASPEMALPFEL